jgi:DNA-binding transcriptional LysR family regulator
VACGNRHRFAGKRVDSLAELAAEAWLAFPRAREATADNLFAQFLVRGVASLRWTPVDSLTAQKRLIEAGFGLALLPESSIREERASGSLATIEVADLRAGNPVFAIVRKGGYLSPAARDLLALLAAQPREPDRTRSRRILERK